MTRKCWHRLIPIMFDAHLSIPLIWLQRELHRSMYQRLRIDSSKYFESISKLWSGRGEEQFGRASRGGQQFRQSFWRCSACRHGGMWKRVPRGYELTRVGSYNLTYCLPPCHLSFAVRCSAIGNSHTSYLVALHWHAASTTASTGAIKPHWNFLSTFH